MLRICIPVHNEATTVGVLLWRLRSVFQAFSREYDVVVYDDASTDGTWEVLEPYQSVMPLTVLRGATHRGYAASIDALVRHVAADDEYARRDAMVLLQGDFTESPEHLPELVKRFEGGADLVAVHRTTSEATPADERRLRRWGRWAVKPFLRLPPVADPFTGFRLVRISVLRELLKALGSRAVCSGDGWAANIDFALNVAPFARRIENVEFAPRYDVRQRASRRRGWTDVVALFHWARAARGTSRPAPGGKAAPELPGRGDRHVDALVMPATTERTSRPVERQDRDRNDRAGRQDRERGGRGARGAEPAEGRAAQTPQRNERSVREERTPRTERMARGDRTTNAGPATDEATPPLGRPSREPRQARPPRPERPARPPRDVLVENASEAGDPVKPDSTELLSDTAAPSAESAATGSPAGEKRSRKRRRRSRRDRGERGERADEAPDGPGAPRRGEIGNQTVESGGGSDENSGDDDAGEDQAGDDGEAGNAASAESGGDSARRKRRPRRRRRGRRPNGADAGGGEGSPPPADPPAA